MSQSRYELLTAIMSEGHSENWKTTISDILNAQPTLINIPGGKDRSVLYVAALNQNYESIDHILEHQAYRTLSIEEKHQLLREIVDGIKDCLLNLYKKRRLTANPITYANANEKIKDAHARGIQYGCKITNPNDHDNQFLGDDYNGLSVLFDRALPELAAEKKYEAYFTYDKISIKTQGIYTYMIALANSLGKFYLTNQAKRNFREALRFFKFALVHCGQLTDNDAQKANLGRIVRSNISATYGAALQEEIKGWGFECKPLRVSSQESLIAALRDQLRGTKFPREEKETYDDLTNLCYPNKDALQSIERSLDPDIKTYLDRLQISDTFTRAQILTLVQVSNVLNVNIAIFQSFNEQPIFLKQANPGTTLYFGVGGKQEIYSVVPCENASPSHFLQEYYIQAPTRKLLPMPLPLSASISLTTIKPAESMRKRHIDEQSTPKPKSKTGDETEVKEDGSNKRHNKSKDKQSQYQPNSSLYFKTSRHYDLREKLSNVRGNGPSLTQKKPISVG